MYIFNQSRILVTGGSGTVGKEVVRQLCSNHDPKEVRILDNNEESLFFLSEAYRDDPRVQCFIGDVRDRDRLMSELYGIDIVVHTAALKHVILCERCPWDAVETNILGMQNLIQVSLMRNVKLFLFTSSDKAVNPTNVMGTSKLMGERLITAANAKRIEGQGPIFFSTRFGNVLGSSGSVVPLFHQQIARGGPVTLTDRRMTRFVMSLNDAVSLVLESVALGKGGEVFIPKMPVARILDLAEIMIEKLAPQYGYSKDQIRIVEIGSRPGEKLYEELMSLEETRRAIELSNQFVVVPAFRSVYSEIMYDYPGILSSKVDRPYNSSIEQPLSKEQLADYLVTHHLI